MFCPNCGTKMDQDSKFCNKCGLENKSYSTLKLKPKEKLDTIIVNNQENTKGLTREEYISKTNIKGINEARRYLIRLKVLFWLVFIGMIIVNSGSAMDEDTFLLFWLANIILLIYFVIYCRKIIILEKISRAWWPFSFFFAPISWIWFYPEIADPLKIIIGEKEPPTSLPKELSDEEKKDKEEKSKKYWKKIKIIYLSILGAIILLGFILFFIFSNTNTNHSEIINDNEEINKNSGTNSSYNQNEIASSVVNIFCPSVLDDEEVSGGSGTIISEDGMILTNSHIIPQDKNNINVGEEGCLVVLPDPATGQPKDIYLAEPIVINDLSDKYDIAFMSIYSAYYDEEEGQYRGIYPRKFPAFDDTTRCNNENIQLGEPVRIYGYPAISGGYSLTITEGIVSSFPGDGLIITSAKISHGNSGGLAIDEHGCMIGIPSMVNFDEAESLGVIMSMDLVNEFIDEADKYLNK